MDAADEKAPTLEVHVYGAMAYVAIPIDMAEIIMRINEEHKRSIKERHHD